MASLPYQFNPTGVPVHAYAYKNAHQQHPTGSTYQQSPYQPLTNQSLHHVQPHYATQPQFQTPGQQQTQHHLTRSPSYSNLPTQSYPPPVQHPMLQRHVSAGSLNQPEYHRPSSTGSIHQYSHAPTRPPSFGTPQPLIHQQQQQQLASSQQVIQRRMSAGSLIQQQVPARQNSAGPVLQQQQQQQQKQQQYAHRPPSRQSSFGSLHGPPAPGHQTQPSGFQSIPLNQVHQRQHSQPAPQRQYSLSIAHMPQQTYVQQHQNQQQQQTYYTQSSLPPVPTERQTYSQGLPSPYHPHPPPHRIPSQANSSTAMPRPSAQQQSVYTGGHSRSPSVSGTRQYDPAFVSLSTAQQQMMYTGSHSRPPSVSNTFQYDSNRAQPSSPAEPYSHDQTQSESTISAPQTSSVPNSSSQNQYQNTPISQHQPQQAIQLSTSPSHPFQANFHRHSYHGQQGSASFSPAQRPVSRGPKIGTSTAEQATEQATLSDLPHVSSQSGNQASLSMRERNLTDSMSGIHELTRVQHTSQVVHAKASAWANKETPATETLSRTKVLPTSSFPNAKASSDTQLRLARDGMSSSFPLGVPILPSAVMTETRPRSPSPPKRCLPTPKRTSSSLSSEVERTYMVPTPSASKLPLVLQAPTPSSPTRVSVLSAALSADSPESPKGIVRHRRQESGGGSPTRRPLPSPTKGAATNTLPTIIGKPFPTTGSVFKTSSNENSSSSGTPSIGNPSKFLPMWKRGLVDPQRPLTKYEIPGGGFRSDKSLTTEPSVPSTVDSASSRDTALSSVRVKPTSAISQNSRSARSLSPEKSKPIADNSRSHAQMKIFVAPPTYPLVRQQTLPSAINSPPKNEWTTKSTPEVGRALFAETSTTDLPESQVAPAIQQHTAQSDSPPLEWVGRPRALPRRPPLSAEQSAAPVSAFSQQRSASALEDTARAQTHYGPRMLVDEKRHISTSDVPAHERHSYGHSKQSHLNQSTELASRNPKIIVASPQPVPPRITIPEDNDDQYDEANRSEPTFTISIPDSPPRITVGPSTPPIPSSHPQAEKHRDVPGDIINRESMIHGLTCHSCGLNIKGRLVHAMNVRWHPDCFKCAVCNTLLEHVSSYEKNGRPYCHLDYYDHFAPRCYHCKTPIADERFITLDDEQLGVRTYHEQHFFCAECGDPFLPPTDVDCDDVGFTVYRGHPYCEACHVRLRLPKCSRCKKSIRDGAPAVEALGGKWCWECFTCSSCNKPFENPAFFQRDNKPYCESCYTLILRNDV